MLRIKDERILRVFNEWEETDKTATIPEAIFETRIGGPLVSSLAFTYCKYANMVGIFRGIREAIQQKVLLEQAIVASCSAYERCLKDMIPWVLKNHKPAAKAFLGSLTRQVKELGRFDFDPFGNVDAIFLEEDQHKKFPVFPEVVDFYRDVLGLDLFPSDQAADGMKLIFEVRNCIVHNAGRPDVQWRRRTNDAEFSTDLSHTTGYVSEVHTRLDDAGVLVFSLVGLDSNQAPFKAAHAEPPFSWVLTDAIGGAQAQGKQEGQERT